MGHAYGKVVIEAGGIGSTKKRMIAPFKNENIYAKKEDVNGKILVVVSDLVCVLDAQNGEALGTQEYRYGLLGIVLSITASEKWTSIARGFEFGGPKGLIPMT